MSITLNRKKRSAANGQELSVAIVDTMNEPPRPPWQGYISAVGSLGEYLDIAEVEENWIAAELHVRDTFVLVGLHLHAAMAEKDAIGQ